MMKGKRVYGVGLYEKGKYHTKTKEYLIWADMLRRCYDSDFHIKQSTYTDCFVCDEWLHFQTFACWVSENYPKDGGNYHLDKDLKNEGNKTYSPENCLFVSKNVNNFLTDHNKLRGEYLIGVCWLKANQKYMAQCSDPFTRKRGYLGLFTDELEAHLAWRKRKSELAYELAMNQTNREVGVALLRWKDMLDMNLIHTYKNKNAPLIGA